MGYIDNAQGETQTVTATGSDTTYTFTMPAANVTVAIVTRTYAITDNTEGVISTITVGGEEVTKAAKNASVTLTLEQATASQCRTRQ